MADTEPKPGQEADESAALVTDSTSYELLKKRLVSEAEALDQKTKALNDARIRAFGRSEMSLLTRLSARTENNCLARDIVRVGDFLLFGYNVFIGLRQEIRVEDVFALFKLTGESASTELEPQSMEGSFLAEGRFVADFRELYTYYKQATLVQLRVVGETLLAAFQIGQKLQDVRVFRWRVDRDGSVRYIDNRGERDIALPASHDFEWTTVTRADHVGGKHPHVNVLDTVFIETIGGDLTVKVENNTETGLGIYAEPVEDQNQSLADAEFAYARLGSLILLKVRPYREKDERFLVFNSITRKIARIDSIGQSCVQLPEDHGIIFPGGYYLQSGEFKRFELPADLAESLRFKRMLKSPNGEDVLFVFYQPGGGRYVLFSYNLIDKRLAAPIVSNGYARFDDGRMLVMQAEGDDARRQHQMQLWQTPFQSEEHVSQTAAPADFYGRIGNAALVRGVSELHAIARAARGELKTRAAFDALIRQGARCVDAHFWLSDADAGGLGAALQALIKSARTTVDEFDKVEAIRRDSTQALEQAERKQQEMFSAIGAMLWKSPTDFVEALDSLREQRGHLHGLRELRYVDLARIDAMDAAVAEEDARVSERAVSFLADEHAFDAQLKALKDIEVRLPGCETAEAIVQELDALDSLAAGLDLLTEHLAGLGDGDAVVRTQIMERISGVYAYLNKVRAQARNLKASLGVNEARAEFGAQFKLFGQAIENALELSDTPEKCDDALTRLLSQLEEIEGRFSEHDQFLADIAEKREALYEAMSARRQSLEEARQRRSQALAEAAERILSGIPRRVSQLKDIDAVHAYFAADALITKLRQQIESVRELGASVLAGDLETRLKTARDQAVRAVRDKQDLLADDGNALRFGQHLFTINKQPLDLTLVPRSGAMHFHLNGTDYFDPIRDERLDALSSYLDQALVSETNALYRAEYLAGLFVSASLEGEGDIDFDALHKLCLEGETGAQSVEKLIRQFAASRYQEGYQKGVHDHDALMLVKALVPMQAEAGLLAHPPVARALALLYWQVGCRDEERQAWLRGARTAHGIRNCFGASGMQRAFEHELTAALAQFGPRFGFEVDASSLAGEAARYLLNQLVVPRGGDVWVISGAGMDIAGALERQLDQGGRLVQWKQDIDAAAPEERWRMVRQWCEAYAASESASDAGDSAWALDAATALMFDVERERRNVHLDMQVSGLLGEHERIHQGALALNLNDFWMRFSAHKAIVVPAFEALQRLRMQLVEEERARLRIDQFKAKPLSSFVRNQLLDKVYLPIIGDNLAKQIGAAGDANRSDRMGMLLLISPPGYGKTTLMEYVADRLGLIFVRINCPALGHDITSIDPATARSTGARQELEKLNLGLAMGNNVMLYLDDIQHTHPEFLQKFIALADGTRRIEAVRNGEPFTCDLRGKRFAIVMAGNPYTESGDVFKIPDMLANRADIYNLGDVLSGNERLFAMSYLENALTANPLLQPLASRDPEDVQRLLRMADGEEVPSSEFSHAYSGIELNELVEVFKRMGKVRSLLLKVNLAYIESAAQKDEYRTEPPFKLQGSYRNMAKLAAKITPLMSDEELDLALRDHYRGEAQTLTTGAEENLLKLAHMIGDATPEEQARWTDIREAFVRRRKMGGDDADGTTRIANTVLDVARAIETLRPNGDAESAVKEGFARIDAALARLKPEVSVQAAPVDLGGIGSALEQMHASYEKVLLPLVNATYLKMKLDHSLWDEVKSIATLVQRMESNVVESAPKSPQPKPRRTQRKADDSKPE